MNNTAKYISELLYRYECVILPGFGAFLTRRESASIQETTHSFYPPKKSISFNRQLQNNDGLLANYIAAAEGISYTDAVAKLQRYALSLRDKMALGKRVELEGIGAFFTSVENTIQFEPTQDVNYLTEAFGMQSFVSPNIEREIPIQREVYKEEVEAIEETTPIAFTPEKRQERPYLQYAAVAAIVIGLGGFFGLKQISNNTISHNNQEWVKANQEIENTIQEATFEISNPLPAISLNLTKEENSAEESVADTSVPVSDDATAGNFHIVAGAFRIASNADKKVQRLKEQGFDARLIGVNKYGLHQVVYASYANRLDALKALRKIKNEQSPKAWLLVQN
ncbi:SPOR domain-containing protein [Aquimarina spongiae]|uniref:Sporulation related domain-containing protein n=1 Tax=Aquimarina spongiae TaxID=570521 RepID=A0A1M6F760_9FLAO|nr:SPOR domain-containing protein [Aquimarina spongiae]SHI93496.1 Sporulation related domain-containing protein [Aquimarina spongiae]